MGAHFSPILVVCIRIAYRFINCRSNAMHVTSFSVSDVVTSCITYVPGVVTSCNVPCIALTRRDEEPATTQSIMHAPTIIHVNSVTSLSTMSQHCSKMQAM